MRSHGQSSDANKIAGLYMPFTLSVGRCKDHYNTNFTISVEGEWYLHYLLRMRMNWKNVSTNNSWQHCMGRNLNCDTVQFYYKFENISKWNIITVSLVNFVTAPLAVFLNFLAIYTIYRRKTLRTLSNLVLCSLALTDMLTGLVSQPLFATLMMTSAFCVSFCFINTFTIIIGNILSSISMASLFLINLDRHISIFYPFYYEKFKEGKLKVLVIVIVIWLINIFVVSASLATPGMVLTTIAASTFALVIFIWSFYVNIRAILVVRKIQRQIKSSYTSTASNAGLENKRNSEVMSRATRIVSTIIGSMLFCYMPFVVFTVFELSTNLPFNAWVWISTLVFLNSLSNPLVYFLQMKEMREEMRVRLNRCFCCRTVAVIRQRLSTANEPPVTRTAFELRSSVITNH